MRFVLRVVIGLPLLSKMESGRNVAGGKSPVLATDLDVFDFALDMEPSGADILAWASAAS